MKAQTLAISLVILLIAVSTLPGLSFSLSSSVTSYDNLITITGTESDFNGMTLDSEYKYKGYNLSDKGTDSAGREYCELTCSNNPDKAFTNGKSESIVTINVKEDVGFWIEVSYGKNSEFSFLLDIGGSLYGSYDYADKGGKAGTIYLGRPQQTGGTLSLITDLNKNNSIRDQHQEMTITVTGSNPSGQTPVHVYFIFDSN